MIILTDCLTHTSGEGCLKVANKLVERICSYDPETLVISFGNRATNQGTYMKLNRAFINPSLFSVIRGRNEPVLYIPFSSNTLMSAFRTCVLSRKAKAGVRVIFTLRHPMNGLGAFLLKKSGATVIALSEDSCAYYRSLGVKAVYLRTGIDTEQFIPVSAAEKEALREKYRVAPGKKVLLHVGHLTAGRNVEKLLDIGNDYHVFLVVSPNTLREDGQALREKLLRRPCTTIVDTYQEHVEELYQMADVYFFPVQQMENCIDVPLSVLEAAACGVPVVTTDYGELKAFKGKAGFRFLETLDKHSINRALDEMSETRDCGSREAVKPYDWDHAARELMELQAKGT